MVTGHIGIHGGVDIRTFVHTYSDQTPIFLAQIGYHIVLHKVLHTWAFGTLSSAIKFSISNIANLTFRLAP